MRLPNEIRSEFLAQAGNLLTESAHAEFLHNIRNYGLSEAITRLKEIELVDEITELYHELLSSDKPDTDRVLPENKVFESLPTSAPSGETAHPLVWWKLREREIREIDFSTEIIRTIEATIPIHHSDRIITEVKKLGVYAGVLSLHEKHARPLAARLLKKYSIPPPPAQPRKYHVREHEPRTRSMMIDTAGNVWTWNLGWYRVDEHGNEKDKKRLGHLTFRRSIKLASTEQLASTDFRYSRPHGNEWRRGHGGKVAHPLFGHGELVLLDGIHAVVRFDDGTTREVIYDNLQKVAHRTPHNSTTSTPRKTTPRPPRTKKSLLTADDLEWLSQLL